MASEEERAYLVRRSGKIKTLLKQLREKQRK
jgi:hypothetical protein